MNESVSQTPAQQSGSSAGVPVEVEVITTNFPSKRFVHRWRLRGELQWHEGDIDVPAGHDHHLHFDIVDDARIGARFKPSPEGAFGAAADGSCPRPGNDGGEIDFKSSNVTGDGMKLFIRDRNHLKGDLTYALFFDSPAGELEYDPIIKNGGGGPPT